MAWKSEGIEGMYSFACMDDLGRDGIRPAHGCWAYKKFRVARTPRDGNGLVLLFFSFCLGND